LEDCSMHEQPSRGKIGHRCCAHNVRTSISSNWSPWPHPPLLHG